ncbi:hypothetical protein [Nocardioides bizhenqiangii]|uniref:DoxX family protein n=1 Tax=Nocardioides bizhenqiangii TaxID=3095076 RepID=A0ABZ0ZNB8_9ACTN|nr:MULTISPECIES: hypothetical protein [unclassified Nocardioides]MDZ5620928.1 hypothetical protein [Nocardioides sp. HM23]WQQ25289.1 hypothetical protein SHK19_15105 [Nocardioides sp. HM61]
MTRSAGVLAVLLGLGFGIPGAIGVRHFAQHHEVWQSLGFPTYGAGPFERAGIPTTVPLLLGFVVVCAAEVGLGVLLLADWHPALWLSLAILPFELAYWTGFALPFGFVLGLARVALTVPVLLRGS